MSVPSLAVAPFQAAVPPSWRFFLGGADLEMEAIRHLLRAGLGEAYPTRVHDRRLAWGARVGDYPEIAAVLEAGGTPVLIELAQDIVLPRHRVVAVDHHGALAGADRPTALEQLFALMGAPPDRWTRDLGLIAANDRGHVPALAALGASSEEIRAVRAADRAAQGGTPEDEAAGATAAARVSGLAAGALTVARVGNGRQASVVADLLLPELGGPGYGNLLVTGAPNLAFYGAGGWVRWLDRRYPGGWTGGALPETGFWGCAMAGDAQAGVVAALDRAMRQGGRTGPDSEGDERHGDGRGADTGPTDH